MPRPRESEMPQQQQKQQLKQKAKPWQPPSPLHLKTGSPESTGAVPSRRGSPKVEDSHRRSPRSPLSEKKAGSRVADLQKKLGQAQEQIKKLKEQLASADDAEGGSKREPEEAVKSVPVAPDSAAGERVDEFADAPEDAQRKHDETPSEDAPPVEGEIQVPSTEVDISDLVPPAAASPVDPSSEEDQGMNEPAAMEANEEREKIEDCGKGEADIIPEAGSMQLIEVAREGQMNGDEGRSAESMVGELDVLLAENASLKNQLAEAEVSSAAALTREEEMALKLRDAVEESAANRARADRLGKQLETVEGAVASLETEMKTLRVQTEQWRKAAEAAAAVLSAASAPNGRRVTERCRSMDKHMGMSYQVGSPLAGGELKDVLSGGRKKGAGSGRWEISGGRRRR
ncbi:unnamed protein product [Spirodela intermedia]|uniref:Uncharacterized protein n=1 Tax=Spirodela intermedia TaxID=51605 RepID=A0A7I8ITM1_SPIIN|nr:unnamed protein product [Spirodela intermedia]CAA6661155.1 unnamed protein product [Spirodela intermedia]